MRAGREHQGLSQAAGQSAGRWLAEFAPPLALAPPRCSTRIGAASCLSPHWGGGARLRSLCRGLRAPRPPELLVVWARAPRPREQGWPETATLWVSGGRTRGSGSGSGVLSPWWEGDGDPGSPDSEGRGLQGRWSSGVSRWVTLGSSATRSLRTRCSWCLGTGYLTLILLQGFLGNCDFRLRSMIILQIA